MDKQLYIIAGCNGAGKTTASYTVLPEILNCREFVNADEIAHGLSPFYLIFMRRKWIRGVSMITAVPLAKKWLLEEEP